MDWIKWLGAVVTVFTFFDKVSSIFFKGRSANADFIKRLKESLIKTAILGSLFYISINIFIFIMIKEIPEWDSMAYILILCFGLPMLFLVFKFPTFKNDMGEVIKIDGKYYVENREKYKFRYKITESYIITDRFKTIRVRIKPYLYTIVTLLLILMYSLMGAMFFTSFIHPYYDENFPFVTNEKFYISSNEDIKNQVVNDLGRSVILPKGTVFSIPKGTNFSVKSTVSEKNAKKQKVENHKEIILGIETNQTIILKKGSQLLFEQEYYKNLNGPNAKNSFVAKTIPGKSSMFLSRTSTFKVYKKASLDNSHYEFIVGKYERERVLSDYILYSLIIIFILWFLVGIIYCIYHMNYLLRAVGILLFSVILTIVTHVKVFSDNSLQYLFIGSMWILHIIVGVSFLKIFDDFWDSYIFIKQSGEEKSISVKLLKDKKEFELYFDNQRKNKDFVIADIREAKNILKVYDEKDEEKGEVQIFWYRNRWQIFSEFFKELKHKTVIFFRMFRRS